MPLQKSIVQSDKPIWYFLICWTLLNIIQAFTLELHSDEAYYWLYSRFLDWGYYDHPPMVALFIRIGDSLMNNELGLRLMTIASSTLALYVLWQIVKRYNADARWFILAVGGMLIFHIYGFITTPDAPLLVFTVLFYFIYQQYAEQDRWSLAVLLALVIAALLYSKYHAVLVMFFTILSNIKLLKRPSFWLIVILSAVLYLPHILWQIHHGYPSVSYHLIERSAEAYKIGFTAMFVPNQLLMAGPLIGWFFFYKVFTTKVDNAFVRCLLVNCIGTLIFFLLNTAKGQVQAHWTLIAYIPFVILLMIQLGKMAVKPRWLYRLAIINLCLIVSFRIILMLQLPIIKQTGGLAQFYGFKEWAQQVKQKAGNAYVIMDDGFQEPSKYSYYTNSLKGFAYDRRTYRRTQFDIWPIEESLQRQRAYYLTNYKIEGFADSLNTPKGIWYGTWVNNVRTFQRIRIETGSYKMEAKAGEFVQIRLKIINPTTKAADFRNIKDSPRVDLDACFIQGTSVTSRMTAPASFTRVIIPAEKSVAYNFIVKAPLTKGTYDLVFSLRTPPFPGGRNNRAIKFTVK